MTWLAHGHMYCYLLLRYTRMRGCPPKAQPETHLPGMMAGVKHFILLSWAFDLKSLFLQWSGSELTHSSESNRWQPAVTAGAGHALRDTQERLRAPPRGGAEGGPAHSLV